MNNLFVEFEILKSQIQPSSRHRFQDQLATNRSGNLTAVAIPLDNHAFKLLHCMFLFLSIFVLFFPRGFPFTLKSTSRKVTEKMKSSSTFFFLRPCTLNFIAKQFNFLLGKKQKTNCMLMFSLKIYKIYEHEHESQ